MVTSTDGGRSWLQSSALYPLPVSNLAEFTVYRGVLTIPLPQISVVDEQGTLLTIRGGTDSRSWVNTGKLSANSLLRSTDGGQNWTVVPSQNVSKLTTIVTNGRGHAVVAGSLGTAPRQNDEFCILVRRLRRNLDTGIVAQSIARVAARTSGDAVCLTVRKSRPRSDWLQLRVYLSIRGRWPHLARSADLAGRG